MEILQNDKTLNIYHKMRLLRSAKWESERQSFFFFFFFLILILIFYVYKINKNYCWFNYNLRWVWKIEWWPNEYDVLVSGGMVVTSSFWQSPLLCFLLFTSLFYFLFLTQVFFVFLFFVFFIKKCVISTTQNVTPLNLRWSFFKNVTFTIIVNYFSNI